MLVTDALALYQIAIQERSDATDAESFDLARWRYANSQAWFAYDDLTPAEQHSVKSPDESVRMAPRSAS